MEKHFVSCQLTLSTCISCQSLWNEFNRNCVVVQHVFQVDRASCETNLRQVMLQPGHAAGMLFHTGVKNQRYQGCNIIEKSCNNYSVISPIPMVSHPQLRKWIKLNVRMVEVWNVRMNAYFPPLSTVESEDSGPDQPWRFGKCVIACGNIGGSSAVRSSLPSVSSERIHRVAAHLVQD